MSAKTYGNPTDSWPSSRNNSEWADEKTAEESGAGPRQTASAEKVIDWIRGDLCDLSAGISVHGWSAQHRSLLDKIINNLHSVKEAIGEGTAP